MACHHCLLALLSLSLQAVSVFSKAGFDSSSTLSSNGVRFPLVGVGVGNLAHEHIRSVLIEALNNHQVRLIDTASASRNEKLIAASISDANTSAGESSEDIHVITKVWYTHLGYGRTKLSVQDSLAALGQRVRVTVLLHWPRCRRGISWMRCDDEEQALSKRVKDAGPSPLDDMDAWQGSWRALEEMYEAGIVSSIGVSNFEMEDLVKLFRSSKVTPHVYQGNLWKVVHDPSLMALLSEKHVVFQAYNVMGGVVQRKAVAPNAYASLLSIAARYGCSEATLVLAWLVQRGISVVPRTSKSEHLLRNAPATILHVKELPLQDVHDIETIVRALLQGRDLKAGVSATFVNAFESAAEVFWVHPETGEEVPASGPITAGGTSHINTYPGHRFVARANEGGKSREFSVTAINGGNARFTIEL
eukprot:TRINITY_DN17193_c0_g1_i1.p1 TRINITY_DN17193_c0_g1~~TRINITY_DN17193_c0_g1_i1.p1  ORF type:complete len:433 (-),score=34.47 TRINITY_DN17193_c0_g1_i1:176-1429(-)